MSSVTMPDPQRYSRHFVLPGFGAEGQQRLRHAKVVVVGAGGLGCPVLQYLTAAGVGQITLIDDDNVQLNNLQRQILFAGSDIGRNKAQAAANHLHALNPDTRINAITARLNTSNAMDVLPGHHLVMDCTDNFATRYLINDACTLLGLPWVYGSVFQYEGQVSVFNLNGSVTYRDLFPLPPKPGRVQDCETAGVLGVLTGIIGSLMANEAVKVLAQLEQPLRNTLLVFDARTNLTELFSVPDRQARKSVTKLIDYDEFCGTKKDLPMKEVTVQELKQLMDSGADFQLIDVREPHEYDICNLNGELIPQAQVPFNVDKISRDKQVVVHCRSGGRSGTMVNWLEKNHGFTNLYNLKGGILAWADQIDPTVTKY
ncbi:MAG: ThiF family adenylyltransferase [Cyclobacteriaceae bacterium]|jgi:molybdopterin/thiamine biosynthesis adenylyltransferase/rhodanese-related sulfurtransferase